MTLRNMLSYLFMLILGLNIAWNGLILPFIGLGWIHLLLIPHLESRILGLGQRLNDGGVVE